VRSGWRAALAVTLACILAGTAAALVLPVTYLSRASLLPGEEGVAQSMDLGGGLLGGTGLELDLPAEPFPPALTAFLRSHGLQERLIRGHDLLPLLYPDEWDAQRAAWRDVPERAGDPVVWAVQDRALEDHYAVSVDMDAELVTLSWQGEDPAWCREMLDAVLAELDGFMTREHARRSREERAFLQERLALAEAHLQEWERRAPGPEASLARIRRETAAAHAVYVELGRQLALAELVEARRAPAYVLLDAPFTPAKRHGPQRAVIVGLSAAGGLLLGLAWAFLRHAAGMGLGRR
jgi:hypothetical protein